MLKVRLIWGAVGLVALFAVVMCDSLIAPGPGQLAGVFPTMLLLGIAILGICWPYRQRDH